VYPTESFRCQNSGTRLYHELVVAAGGTQANTGQSQYWTGRCCGGHTSQHRSVSVLNWWLLLGVQAGSIQADKGQSLSQCHAPLSALSVIPSSSESLGAWDQHSRDLLVPAHLLWDGTGLCECQRVSCGVGQAGGLGGGFSPVEKLDGVGARDGQRCGGLLEEHAVHVACSHGPHITIIISKRHQYASPSSSVRGVNPSAATQSQYQTARLYEKAIPRPQWGG
jgi:hypothetical protein